MSEKDYEAIAESFRYGYRIARKQQFVCASELLDLVRDDLIHHLKSDNPRFDRAGFINECRG